MINKFKALLCFAVLLITADLTAEGPFYTYVGGFTAGGMNRISYSDWIDNETRTNDVTGYNVRAGVLAVIFVNFFAGEFGLSGSFNMNSMEETQVHSADWYGLFKYVFKFNDSFSLTTGPGIYMETLPASRQYDGGGLQYSLGSCFSVTSDWNIETDLFFRYGYFGIGEDSTKMNYGIQVSVTRKVGNL
ncbi:MAG: hypothetical protein JW982_16215 [Spirochaetes bacterium]|nr:hypothetical protein [Spirochaetota bacterium]